MAICADLSDVNDPDVAALVPAWLALVADRYCPPGVRVLITGASLSVLLPVPLLLRLAPDDLGWVLEVKSHELISALGPAGRPFACIGTVRPRMDAGLADPSVAVARLTELSDPLVLLPLLEPGPDSRLLAFWRARCGLTLQ